MISSHSNNISAIFFDVGGTLLDTPELIPRVHQVLIDFGFDISESCLRQRHKILSELILFPDRTDEQFYYHFNSEFLLSLGVEPTEALLTKMLQSCSKMDWQPFSDVWPVLMKLDLPLGICSNWNTGLNKLLEQQFDKSFNWIICSENEGVRKPNLNFFKLMTERSGVRAENILYVGDSYKLDYLPAKKLGFQTILIDRVNIYSFEHEERIRSMTNLNRFIRP